MVVLVWQCFKVGGMVVVGVVFMGWMLCVKHFHGGYGALVMDLVVPIVNVLVSVEVAIEKVACMHESVLFSQYSFKHCPTLSHCTLLDILFSQ